MAEPGSKLAVLGERLRRLRKQAGLSQVALARRMGLTGKGGHFLVGGLERGIFKRPTIPTIDRFLRACGARWMQLADVLDGVDSVPLNLKPPGRVALSDTAKEQAHAATAREARHYEREEARPVQAEPPKKEEVIRRADRLRNYRLVANVIEQAVGQMLRETPLPPLHYSLYYAVGRHLLGMLWRAVRTERGRQELVASAPILPERLARRLEQKDKDWTEQRLDLELTARVQALVLAWFLELLRQNPELFPGAAGVR